MFSVYIFIEIKQHKYKQNLKKVQRLIFKNMVVISENGDSKELYNLLLQYIESNDHYLQVKLFNFHNKHLFVHAKHVVSIEGKSKMFSKLNNSNNSKPIKN